MTNTKWEDICKAVEEFNEANSCGPLDPMYGELMYDKSDGEIWCDVFVSSGHNEWKVYHSDTIFNLGRAMAAEGIIDVTAQDVKEFIENEKNLRNLRQW